MISKQKIIIGAASALAAIGLTTGIIVANVNDAKDPSQPSLSLEGTNQSAGSTNATAGKETTGSTEGSSTEATVTPTQPPHEHSYPDEWTVVRDPDCENAGIKVRFCACGHQETQIVPATGHSGTIWVDNEDGTHTEKYSCCNQPVHDTEEHNYDQWTIVTASTCTQKGLQESYCTQCGRYATEVIDAFGHGAYIECAEERYLCTAASCSGPATYYKCCSDCGEKSEETFSYGEVQHIYDPETGLCPCYADCSAGLTYEEDWNGDGWRVSQIPYDLEEVKIPAYYMGKPVTSVDDYAICGNCKSIYFPDTLTNDYLYLCYGYNVEHVSTGNAIRNISFYNCANLKSVTFGDSISTIDLSYCTSLTDIEIPEGVTSINCNSCSALKSIKIPDSVTSISFRYCSALESVKIPNSVTKIESQTFIDCTSLTEVTIPHGVTSVGYQAFYGCTNLQSITFPDSVTSVGTGAVANTAFFDDSSNWESNVLYINKCLIAAKTTLSGTYTVKDGTKCIAGSAFNDTGVCKIIIPDTVLDIGEKAFYDCTMLSAVNIPNTVTIIRQYTFYNCKNLQELTIPNSVTKIEAYACGLCTSMRKITLPFVGSNPDSGHLFGWVFGKYNFNLIQYTQYLLVPDTLNEVVITGGKNLASEAFYGLSGIQKITLPSCLANVGEDAFLSCSGLKEVHISDLTAWCQIDFAKETSNPLYNQGVKLYIENEAVTDLAISGDITSISNYAFYNCTSLTSANIPESVTCIGRRAFYNCTNLTIISIPDSVTSIGSSVFDNTAYCDNAENWQNDALYIGNNLIKVDSTKVSGEFVIKNETSCVAGSAFSGCSNLTGVAIPSSVTSIGDHAFYNCTGLTSIEIPSSVTSIGSYAFSGCSSLTSIEIPSSVTSIGEYSFRRCTGLTNITIPDSVTNIGSYVFNGCTGLASVTFAENSQLTSIGGSAFYGCSNLESITLPFVGKELNGTSNTHFGYVFGASKYSENSKYVPSTLKNVVITGGASIGNYAFYGCTSLTSITIPDSVTSIGNYAFRGCTGLTSITIPDSVTSIGSSAFYNCTGLTSIIIPDSVTRINASAFYYCSELTSIMFNGTQEQWEAITKGTNWNSNTGSYTIHCTDGDISKDGTFTPKSDT